MSPLPRLAEPRGPSQRIAAMVARAPAAPAEQLELPLTPLDAPPTQPPPPRWQGPLLLQPHAPTLRAVEQRERYCPRVVQCEDDWIAAGCEGQARCPAGCGVWRAVGGEGGE